MTPEQVRQIALSFPEAVEGEHMGHPDFRVGGRVFATLWPSERRAVLVLTPEEQEMVVGSEPETFSPVPGGWGRRGATSVALSRAQAATLREAMRMAWRRRAPKRLLKAVEERGEATHGRGRLSD